MENQIWEKVLALANESLLSKDVPIGAIIMKDGAIIGVGYNTREKNQSVLGHAEINAIRNAAAKLNNWNLNGSIMYVSLKPCSMCTEIIKQSRISKVYYLLDKPKEKLEFNKTLFDKFDNEIIEMTYANVLSNFFKELREKNSKL